jgi:hypothetical protein
MMSHERPAIIVAVADGRVVEVGSYDQLMAPKGFCHDLCMSRSRSSPAPAGGRRSTARSSPGLARHDSHLPLGAAAIDGPQARALAFSRPNSDWSIAPASSSSLARAICSVGVVSPVAATLRT